MKDIKDCKGRLTCKADAITGMVEQAYKGCKTKMNLAIGGSISIERDNILTVVIRISSTDFKVDSYPIVV